MAHVTTNFSDYEIDMRRKRENELAVKLAKDLSSIMMCRWNMNSFEIKNEYTATRSVYFFKDFTKTTLRKGIFGMKAVKTTKHNACGYVLDIYMKHDKIIIDTQKYDTGYIRNRKHSLPKDATEVVEALTEIPWLESIDREIEVQI